MKKQFFLSVAALLTAGTILMNGCKKDDTTPPTITLKGSSPWSISLGSAGITDPGATAQDDKDGDLSSKITSDWSSTNPNLAMKGAYTITYSVADAAGNTTTSKRTVNVVNDADYLAGAYNADDTCAVSYVAPYTATITASTTINKQFSVSNFGGFGTSTNVTLTVSGTTVGSTFSWGAQSLDVPTNVLSAATNTGAVASLSPVTFGFTYQWSSGGPTELCTSKYTHQ